MLQPSSSFALTWPGSGIRSGRPAAQLICIKMGGKSLGGLNGNLLAAIPSFHLDVNLSLTRLLMEIDLKCWKKAMKGHLLRTDKNKREATNCRGVTRTGGCLTHKISFPPPHSSTEGTKNFIKFFFSCWKRPRRRPLVYNVPYWLCRLATGRRQHT